MRLVYLRDKKFTLLKTYLFLHPLIDMLTSIMVAYSGANITIGVVFRTVFMIIGVGYLIFNSRSKYKEIGMVYYFILAIYFMFFLYYCYTNKGFIATLTEIKWIAKVFYLPIVCLIMMCLYDEGFRFNMEKLNLILAIYVISIVISNLTGFSLATYPHSKTGFLGLYYSANEISAIICILLPFLIAKIIIKRNIFNFIILLAVIYCSLFMGTKTPFLGLIIVSFGFLMIYVIKHLINRNYQIIIYILIAISLIIIVSIFILPYTPLQQNLEIHANFLNVGIEDLFKIETIDRLILSDRLTFLKDIQLYYNNVSIPERLIGIGYVVESIEKTIEMDYFDLFYRYGYIGFTIYFLPIVYMSIELLKKIELKKIFDYNYLAYLISYMLCLILALVTGHVFTAPAVSIYFVIIMLELNYYSQKKVSRFGNL